MKFAKRMLMVVGSVALAAMLLSVPAPKAVHATVAALVNVVNTAANPAGTEDISKAASQIVELQCLLAIPEQTTSCESRSAGLTYSSFTVPAGQTLIITSVDISAVPAGPGTTAIALFQDHLGEREVWVVPSANVTQLQFPSSGIPISSGSTLIMQNISDDTSITSNGSTAQAAMVIHGYLTSN
jgi:hypothetical protein